MDRFINENVKKASRLNVGYLILSAFFLIFGILFIVVVSSPAEAVNLAEYGETEDATKNTRVYIDLKSMTEMYAQYDNTTDGYYFASDGKYMYIVYLKESEYNKIIASDLDKQTYRLEGITKDIDDELKDFTINTWNEELEESDTDYVLSNDNFYKAFGYFYLDQTVSDDSFLVVMGVIFALAGVAFLIYAISISNKFKKQVNALRDDEVDTLNQEIANESTKYFKSGKLFVTPNYVIIMSKGFYYYKYEDILWMYIKSTYYNFVKTSNTLIFLTNDGITHNSVAPAHPKELINEMYTSIMEHNPNITEGYNFDNIKHFNQVVKEIKKNNK